MERIISKEIIDDKVVGKCAINIKEEKEGVIWEISSWYVDNDYQNQGIGRKLLKRCLNEAKEKFGIPSKIDYVWNGTNHYVYDWLEKNFNPVIATPISVLKYQEEDDWLSHIYHLNTKKVLEYFEIRD
ncbi:MAG: GNAT family N-acetyltransferase [Clostridia bacterium]|nr:GNAT family N-acetyltransferase [Clostridia bacterium]